jgi:hypothetical protein
MHVWNVYEYAEQNMLVLWVIYCQIITCISQGFCMQLTTFSSFLKHLRLFTYNCCLQPLQGGYISLNAWHHHEYDPVKHSEPINHRVLLRKFIPALQPLQKYANGSFYKLGLVLLYICAYSLKTFVGSLYRRHCLMLNLTLVLFEDVRSKI